MIALIALVMVVTRVDGERYTVQGSEQRVASGCGEDGGNGGNGGGDRPSDMRHTAARTGLRVCGTWRPERVFGCAARGGTKGSSGVQHAAARTGLLVGTIGCVTGGSGDAEVRKARGGCIVMRLRGEERNTPPRSLYISLGCAHAQRRAVTAPGLAPGGPTYLHC